MNVRSRRLQNVVRKKSTRPNHFRLFLLFGVLLVSLLILFVSTVGEKQFGPTHKVILELIAPLQSVTSNTSRYIRNRWQDYASLWTVLAENKQLKAELQEYKKTNLTYREAVATNIQLRKLLKFKETLPPPTLTTTIIGRDPSPWSRIVIIDRGSRDGVEKGMPVVTAAGVVGQILDTTLDYSKVILANDPNSAIDVLVQNSRVRGIIRGKGESSYQLHYVFKNSDISENDQIISSELGGVFPKGLPVGTVSSISQSRRGMFLEIEVTSSVDFSRLENLIVIMKKKSIIE